jgi:phage terminase large subunit
MPAKQSVIVQAGPKSKLGFECFGVNREFFYAKDHERMLSGPYETGKTITALNLLNLLLGKYPNARALMVRETYTSLINSAVVTFEQKVLPVPPGDLRSPIRKFGESKPEWYDYPNGSRLVLGGMDNPDKFLSAEFDYVYVNQAEGVTQDGYEKLVGRCTGRAGNVPYPYIFGDCNPDGPQHYIINRPSLRVFYSRHEDNPTLYDQATGEITERGRITMATLDSLTGVRYKRGRLGLWVAAEGQVYEEFDPAVHLINRFEIPSDWQRFRSIDFGYVHPFVCQWWAVDHDGRMYRYREIYTTGQLVEDLAASILLLSEGENISYTVSDHDAEDRATLERHGVPTIPANKNNSKRTIASHLPRCHGKKYFSEFRYGTLRGKRSDS